MDPVTIGILGGMMTVMMTIMTTIVIYLDRSSRADMNAGFKRVDERLNRIDERLNRLTDVVFDLVKTVGELKGRSGTSTPIDTLSAAE